ncbi:MAG: hypothetical protein MI799_22355 [Desulfobacterales bacterium]|nr:hypothetical protein [Desulfobacterales bacterium]
METNTSAKELASAVYKKTKKDLRKKKKKKGHSIEKRINKIQVGADEETFISFVLSDTFPDEFKDGESVGFVDVSGFGDRLPDGQYEVKIYFDEDNHDKQSEFINVTTGKQYYFDTDTRKIKVPKGINACEYSIKKGCTWITVLMVTLHGDAFLVDVCLDCPECYG